MKCDANKAKVAREIAKARFVGKGVMRVRQRIRLWNALLRPILVFGTAALGLRNARKRTTSGVQTVRTGRMLPPNVEWEKSLLGFVSNVGFGKEMGISCMENQKWGVPAI